MKKEDLVMDIMFFRTADIDLKNYASTNISGVYPETVTSVLKEASKGFSETIKTEEEQFEKDLAGISKPKEKEALKNAFSEKKEILIKEFCGKLMEKLSTVVILDVNMDLAEAFREAANRPVKPFPMDIVMKMYHSGNDLLEKKSKDIVIDNYGMYVYDIIHRHYTSYAQKYGEELYQCGCIGLLTAMVNYDTRCKFNTYCTKFVLHEISAQINFHNNSTTVHFNNIQKKINQAIADIKSEGLEPSIEKIAIMTELKRETIEREWNYLERTRFQYLDADEGKDRACEYEATPEALFAQKERDDSLHQAIMDLPEDYRRIVLMKCSNCTNEYIASEMKTTVGKIKTKYQKGLQLMKRNPRLYETYSDYYSEATIHMAHYSVNAIMPTKAIEEQMDDLMECIGTLNSSDKGIYYVDASDPMGQMTFCV